MSIRPPAYSACMSLIGMVRPTDLGGAPSQRVRSRYGCKNCKSRKIKCDEFHPRCGNCLDRDLACSFTPMVADASSQPKMPIPRLAVAPRRRARTPAALSPCLEHILYRGQPVESRMLELRLLNFYMHRAGDPAIFSADPELQPSALLALAFENEYLMDSVLALTANVIRLNQAEDRRLIGASHGYIARSIQKQRQAVGSNLQLSSFEPVYINSLLIAALTLLQHQFVPLEKDDGQDLPQWFQVLRGLGAITATSSTSFRQSKVATALPVRQWHNPIQDQLKTWPGIFTGVLFEVLIAGLHVLYPGLSLDRYLPVLSYLSLVSQSPTRHILMRFMFEADPGFVALLSQGDAIARLLLGVYFAVWGAASVNPWLDPVAKRDLRLIFRLLKAPEAKLLQKVIDAVKAQDQ